MRYLTPLACIVLGMSLAACFVPKYESYFEPSSEGARIGSTYCAENRHGPPALAEFLIESTPIVVYAYRKPEEPATVVITIAVSLKDGQTLLFNPQEVKAIDPAVKQGLKVSPDHWSRHFLGVSETHTIEGPLDIIGRPRFKGGLDRVVVFLTMAAIGTNHFSVEFPELVIAGSALTIPAIDFTEKSGLFALPVFGNC